MVETTSQVIELLEQQNTLLSGIYTNQLFVIGCSGGLLVLFLLFKFIKKFI